MILASLALLGWIFLAAPARAQLEPIYEAALAAFQSSLITVPVQGLSKPKRNPAEQLPANIAHAQVKNPCSDNTDLEKLQSITFKLQGKDGKEALALKFQYSGECTAIDRDPDGDPITPRAKRRFSGNIGNAGYDLYIITELGSADSELYLTQSLEPGAYLLAADLGSKATKKILTGPVDFGEVSVADYRGKYKQTPGKAVLEASPIYQ